MMDNTLIQKLSTSKRAMHKSKSSLFLRVVKIDIISIYCVSEYHVEAFMKVYEGLQDFSEGRETVSNYFSFIEVYESLLKSNNGGYL